MFLGSGVYKITSPSGRIYIGSSKDLKLRLRDYMSLHCSKQRKIYNSLKKYGANNHNFEVLCYCEEKDLLKLESQYGMEYDCLNKKNLNISLPKSDSKYKTYSDEELMLRSLRSTGKKHTEKTKQKISEKNKGNKHSLGHKHTQETKKKISNYHKGNKYNLGKKYSLERIEKAKLSRLPLSKESKLKMGARRKIVLNIETGIYYDSLKDASLSIGMKKATLSSMLLGKNKNKTSFIYA